MSQQAQRYPKPAVGHIVMAASGWVLYLFAPYTPVLVLAIILSVLIIPRFLRGSQAMADARVTHELERTIKPSPRVAKWMLPDERLRLEVTDHPISMLVWYLLGALLTAAAGALLFFIPFSHLQGWMIWTILIIWIVGMAYASVRLVLWHKGKLCITDQRIFVVRGIIKIRHEFMPLSKLATAKIQTPWHSTVLSALRIIRVPYGTLIADAAGEEDELKKNHFVPYINQITRMLGQRPKG